MTSGNLLHSLELDHNQLCNHSLKKTLLWLAVLLVIVVSIFYFNGRELTVGDLQLQYFPIALLFVGPALIVFLVKWRGYVSARGKLIEYRELLTQLKQVEKESNMPAIQETMASAQLKAKQNHLVKKALEQYLPTINLRLGELRQAELRSQFEIELLRFESNCDKELTAFKNEVPLVKAKANIEASLEFLKQRREEITNQWQQAYEQFSWWNKCKYFGEKPDFTEMDKVVTELEYMALRLTSKYSDDLSHLNAHFEQLKTRALSRVSKAKAEAERFIQECGHQEGFGSDLLKKSLWLSALSLPVSVWTDVDRAGDVYDALRDVNSNFAGMSDAEIWWEALFLPSHSLAGLASLTKGAYFEQLVAADTGGVLFEHFNNPDTDIVIDGIGFQLKATDSAGYVNSVAEDIPVIATSEVALKTGAIDSGYSNEELTNTVDLALGGTVVDVGDSVADAILAGVGGLGFFATVEGINHAAAKHENGGDAIEAMFEGAGVAIEGTAKALVGAAEMSYKVMTSRPSKFVGRLLMKGLNKLDDKIMNESGRK